MNDKNQVLCHHFSGVRGALDVYSLMRQTVEPNKSLEEMVAFGLEKEFGVRANIKCCLGSIISRFINWEGADVEKTTAYFLCEYESVIEDPKMEGETLEGIKGNAEWIDINDAVERMKVQSASFGRTDYDESEILQRAREQKKILAIGIGVDRAR